jgi:hypothetical protein
MKRLLALVLMSAPLAAAEPMLFIYFKEPANMGVFYAVSDDGLHWKALNGGRPWIGIEHANELIRDPFITRGPDHEFHMVWTWGWRGTSIGYAHSPDLIHWSDQREIPIMANVPGTKNTWAPEIYWDAAKSQWLIIFSSTVDGKHDGNRIYAARTKDFREVSKPEIFFDPGYWVIDATMLQTRGKYYLVFKDERADPLHKTIKIAESSAIDGPWTNISDEFTESWSEGPSAVQVGDEYIVYYDHYREPRRYEAVRSSDLKHWAPVPIGSGPGQLQIPESCKHGSFMKITAEERDRLLAARGSTIAQSLPDLYHDETAGDPPFLSQPGWRPLLNGRDLAGWHAENQTAHEWFTAQSVNWKRIFAPLRLQAKPAPGDRIVNGAAGKTANLVTDATFGSFELYAEFLLAKGSNSGIFLHGLYEVQIFDSYGYTGPLAVGDCGGIYEMPDATGGSPPLRNATRPPGEWQSLHIWFQAPKVDAISGRTTGHAKVLRVMLNGVLVQDNVAVGGPTTSHMNLPEAPKNPVMLQGDHGPVAFRNIYIREFE